MGRGSQVSDVASGRQEAWPARPGRARFPVKAPAWPEKTGAGGCGSHRAGARGESRCGCRPPGLPAVVPQARDPAARPPLPRAALPVACRCHPAPAGTTAASRREPAPQRRAQPLPGADVLPQPPVPVFPTDRRLHGGPRPSRARRPRLQARHHWPDTGTRTPHATCCQTLRMSTAASPTEDEHEETGVSGARGPGGGHAGGAMLAVTR
jgi:hypothetical protein